MRFLTDFADQAVILPFALVVTGALGVARWWRGLAAWLLTVGSVLGGILVLKVIFFACAPELDGSGIISPSGHTASSAIVYGGLSVLLLRGRVRPWWLVVLPVAITTVFAISRLVLHAHTLGDVMLGGAVGLAGVLVQTRLAGQRPALRPWPLGIAAVVVAMVFHGFRLPAEIAIHRAALANWMPLLAVCR